MDYVAVIGHHVVDTLNFPIGASLVRFKFCELLRQERRRETRYLDLYRLPPVKLSRQPEDRFVSCIQAEVLEQIEQVLRPAPTTSREEDSAKSRPW